MLLSGIGASCSVRAASASTLHWTIVIGFVTEDAVRQSLVPLGQTPFCADRQTIDASFMQAAQVGFDRHLPILAAAKKMTIAWNGEHV